jgi:hypothetical protein
MIEKGELKELEGDYALVEVTRLVKTGRRGGGKTYRHTVEIRARNNLQARPGDQVELESDFRAVKLVSLAQSAGFFLVLALAAIPGNLLFRRLGLGGMTDPLSLILGFAAALLASYILKPVFIRLRPDSARILRVLGAGASPEPPADNR